MLFSLGWGTGGVRTLYTQGSLCRAAGTVLSPCFLDGLLPQGPFLKRRVLDSSRSGKCKAKAKLHWRVYCRTSESFPSFAKPAMLVCDQHLPGFDFPERSLAGVLRLCLRLPPLRSCWGDSAITSLSLVFLTKKARGRQYDSEDPFQLQHATSSWD